MTVYVVVRTARKDVVVFPGYFPEPHKPAICIVDIHAGDSCTSDRSKAEGTVERQIVAYGEYFDYTIHELEV